MFAEVAAPIVSLLNSLMGPLLWVVGSLGSLYCVIIGVRYAKAEEPQDREKAKQSLKGAVIGFCLIFVLILALNIMMPEMVNWVNENAVGSEEVITGFDDEPTPTQSSTGN